MQQFVIERAMPGAGKMSMAELKGASRQAQDVLDRMGPDIEWIRSYVTDDKIYCIYRAADEDLIRRHAQAAGIPADKIATVRSVIDPTTAG